LAPIAFKDVFGNINLSANVRTTLKNTLVEKITFNKHTKLMDVDLSSDTIINEDCLADFADDVRLSFEYVSDARVHLKYCFDCGDISEILQQYRTNILKYIKRQSPMCCGIFENADYTVEGNRIIFTVDSNAAFLFKGKGIAAYIEGLLNERFDLNCKVEFCNRGNVSLSDSDNAAVNERIKRAIKRDFAEDNGDVSPDKIMAAPVARSEAAPRDTGKVKRARLAAPKDTPIEEEAIPVSACPIPMENAVLEGLIFAVDELVKTKKGSLIVKFYLADKTGAIMAKMFMQPEAYDGKFASMIKTGKYVKIAGRAERDSFEHDEPVILVNRVTEAEAPPERMDNAPEKRVELHLHTQMSKMDGITSATEYIKRAHKWGHRAIAITDHGVVQAFPEALHAVEGKYGDVKILYGCEAYLVDDLGSVVQNYQGQSLEDEFVVFDLETTGLKKEIDKIIEIGAVKVKNGEVVDKFSKFVNPHTKLDEKIVKLTNITDDMLADAEDASVILPQFLEFAGDSVLVAHNASFDVGFIRQWAIENDYKINPTVLDTVELAKVLFPELKNFKLDTVCERLEVSLENHHRAVDDAGATAEIFVKCIPILKERGVKALDEINTLASEIIDKRHIKQYYHAIILVQNQVGLRNLYELVSDSHIKYFLRRPKIPKSELIKHREGLILGSACEAGELYTALYENQPEDIIKGLVDFYDYLEIQPIGNNMFMLNNQSKSGKAVESVDRLYELNREIVALGERYNKPVVATCDVHFIDPEDEIYRRIVQAGDGFKDVDNQAPLYLRTTEEMLDEFKYLGEEKAYEVVVTNTNLVADWLEDVRPISRDKCPPIIENSDQQLRDITVGRAKEIYGDPLPKVVEDRLEIELSSIIDNGYSVLYISAQKLVWDSMDHGYIVGSRGSVGSSFAATMAGITEVNPLEPHYICPNCKYSDFDSEDVLPFRGSSGFDMPDKMCPVCGTKLNKEGQAIPFQTFLGFKGNKEPDIDLNFSGEYQQQAHRYCEELFGKEFVFKAGTIGSLQEKTVYGYINKYCEIPNHKIQYFSSAEKKRIAAGCVGVKRTTGQHPGGLVVVPYNRSIYEFTPVQRPADEFTSVVKTTHFDYHSIDQNLLKLDMLGHDVPTILHMYKDMTGFDPLKVPMDDKATLSLFTSPKALGVTEEQIHCNTGSLGLPEFGTNFVRTMLIETQPSSFSDLVRISGLSHGTDVWTGNAQELIKNGVVTLKEVIPTRDDIMLYLIRMGVENETSFKIMEMVRKGKGLTEEYEATMREHNVPDWYIDSCKKIQYMFPKGHAVAYVTNTFRIGYFKINFPYAFYAASFYVKSDSFDYNIMCFGAERVMDRMKEIDALGRAATANDKTQRSLLELVYEMYMRGFKFVPMDLYKADATQFLITEDGIMAPFCVLPNLSRETAPVITRAREDGEFSTIEQFRERTGLGKTVTQMLKDNGILAGIPETNQMSLFG
jgi:DNA polymerase-3 subunit alpha (Gram-positive type)